VSIIESSGIAKNGALVDSEGRLSVFSVTEGEDRHVNQTTGKMWSIPFEITTTGANAYITYINNTGTKNLHITDVRMTNTGTASVVDIDYVSGTPAGTTTLTPVSRNLGNPVIMAADIYVASAGTGITGLTDEGLLFPKFSKANDEMHLRTTSNIIIPPGQATAIKIVTSGGIYKGAISIAEINIETGGR
jgi:hypothetical protein